MADASDIETALREAVQAVRDGMGLLFPVYRGWPMAAVLDGVLHGSVRACVTIYERPGFERNTSRLRQEETALPGVPPTLTVTNDKVSATFAGTGSADQFAGIRAGQVAYTMRLTATDTPSTVASALRGLIPGAGGTGATVTAASVQDARTARLITTVQPVRSIEKGFSVIVWSADPLLRDTIASGIDGALAVMPFIKLPDGTQGHLTYSSTRSTDIAEGADLYRRDLHYAVDYPTTITRQFPPILFADGLLRNVVASLTVLPPPAPLLPSIVPPVSPVAAPVSPAVAALIVGIAPPS